MTGRLPLAEIPQGYWQKITEVDFRSDDMVETMESLQGDAAPFLLMLGASGVYLATQIRLHNFGELADAHGTKIEEKKQNPLWLATEAQCIKENLDAQKQSS